MLKARESLVRNFVIVLLKKLLNDTEDYKEILRISTALNVAEQMHKGVYVATLKDKLSGLFRAIDDENIDKTFPILQKLTESWEFLDKDVQQKIQAYVADLPGEKLEELNFLIEHSGLSDAATRRANKASRTELKGSIFVTLPPQVGNRIVELYANSGSFDQANSFSTAVTRNSSDFNKEQVEKIIRACGDNYEIKNSFEVGAVINAMRRNKSVTNEEIDIWLNEVDLKEYVKAEPEEENG